MSPAGRRCGKWRKPKRVRLIRASTDLRTDVVASWSPARQWRACCSVIYRAVPGDMGSYIARIRYHIPTQEVTNALVTTLQLQVSMGGGGYLFFDGSHIRLPLDLL
ncbi:hypothetical protein EVAR_75327_1 [Eumeta japonica]|uniref:Uncharacterized protein n=1 Tax=Eumeta variegata TaxID=151549 RepID=A0A4C1Y008_EUMVA|nr:hypothetical protein EVAR_75327_1 [Eumeta japonica]